VIAETCVDRGISLLTRDRDFRAFAEAARLNLVPASGELASRIFAFALNLEPNAESPLHNFSGILCA